MLDGSVITYRFRAAATRLVSRVASIGSTMLASVYSAHVLDGHVRKHCAWTLVGCSSVFGRFCGCGICHPASVHGRTRYSIQRQHCLLVRAAHLADSSFTPEILPRKPSNQSVELTAARRTATLFMTKTSSLRAPLALGGSSSLLSR